MSVPFEEREAILTQIAQSLAQMKCPPHIPHAAETLWDFMTQDGKLNQGFIEALNLRLVTLSWGTVKVEEVPIDQIPNIDQIPATDQVDSEFSVLYLILRRWDKTVESAAERRTILMGNLSPAVQFLED